MSFVMPSSFWNEASLAEAPALVSIARVLPQIVLPHVHVQMLTTHKDSPYTCTRL